VNGILKAYRNQKDALALSLYFEGNSIEVTDREFSEISISEEDEERILEFAKSGNLLSDFVAAIAPTIYGFSEVKEAVALQLFGGTSLKYADGTTKRGDIHVLLVGDPGISKSKLLQSVLAICPRGILVSGKSSSTAGLTATAVKDSEGIWTLEAGAVVLADNGQLLIDEVDKMRDEDTSALHQALEQQQVAIAKAGIVTTLNSRCSLLAAMNPKLGRFEDIADLAEQINLPPTLLSRFDLIFLLLDHPDADKDKRIATHIINGAAITGDIQFLRKYVAYAKRNIFPKLTDEAKTKITEYYCEVRGLSTRGKAVPLTARQLEALVRLCEASARMRLSKEVSVEDAEVATRVLDTCLRGIAYDAATGTFDIDKAHNKMSRNSREKAMDLLSICKTLSQDNPYGWPIETLCDICTLKPRADLEKELQKLIDNNLLFMPKTGKYKIV
jgi:replicative DNA helicase Mcm